MADKKDITVRANLREGRGKNDARRTRREGKVPVTVYGGEGGTVAAVAPLKELAAILQDINKLTNEQQKEVNATWTKVNGQPLTMTVTGPKTPMDWRASRVR